MLRTDKKPITLGTSIERMRDLYPGFSLSLSTIDAGFRATWTGKLQPIQTRNNLEELLDDLNNEREFWILPGGEVIHHPRCTTSHSSHGWTNELVNPQQIFEIQIGYLGGTLHPRARVLAPLIPEEKQKHMFRDGSICPYAPWLEIWRCNQHDVVDYMTHVLGWLIKWMVWDQVGIWLGREINHDTRFLLRNIGRNNQCWCGSGKKYKKCHLFEDEAAVVARRK